MRFLREYLIILIILIIVFCLEYFTSKNLKEAVGWMKEEIVKIEEQVNENQEEAQKQFYELEKNWKDKSDQLALFVEHNELEKVSNDIVIIQSSFETDETDKVLENIADLKFMLDHIEEKNQLKLKNIF